MGRPPSGSKLSSACPTAPESSLNAPGVRQWHIPQSLNVVILEVEASHSLRNGVKSAKREARDFSFERTEVSEYLTRVF